MAVSRHRNQNIIDNKYFETFDFPNIDKTKIQTFSIRITDSDRLDSLAFKFLGNGEYWWIIAWLNDIDWIFNFSSGQIIEIPVNIDDILKLI